MPASTPRRVADPFALVGYRDELTRALATLSGEEREAISLRFGAGLTVPEMASTVAISGTVRPAPKRSEIASRSSADSVASARISSSRASKPANGSRALRAGVDPRVGPALGRGAAHVVAQHVERDRVQPGLRRGLARG